MTNCNTKEVNITIKQNKDWFFSLLFRDDKNRKAIVLNDYEAKLTIRNYEETEIIESLSTTNGDIVISPVLGKILCHLTNERTKNMNFVNDSGKYELVISKNNIVTQAIRGDVCFEKAIVEVNP